MANWKVEGLYVAPSLDGHSDVVTQVAWACEGNNSMRGKLDLGAAGQPFVSYADLTEDTVLSWVWARVDKAFVEKDVDASLPAALTVTLKPLPWSN